MPRGTRDELTEAGVGGSNLGNCGRFLSLWMTGLAAEEGAGRREPEWEMRRENCLRRQVTGGYQWVSSLRGRSATASPCVSALLSVQESEGRWTEIRSWRC